MTPPRQVWLFQLGCWMAWVTAAIHLAGHVFVAGTQPPVSGSPAYLFLIPNQPVPDAAAVADGLSLALPLLLVTLGAAGLVVHRRGADDPALLRGVARAYALGTGILLAVSVLSFFSLLSFLLVVTALCFALAGVTET